MRPAHLKKLIYFFRDDLPFLKIGLFSQRFAVSKTGLFSRATCPFKEISLFPWVTRPFQIPKKNFSKRSCFPEIDLFSWATCPF
jgi:hypothetical protein